MIESDLQDLVVDACARLGLLCYHTYDSRRSVPGWPDLAIVGGRMIFRELKTAKGVVSKDQRHWLMSMRMAGQDVAVWRPGHWESGLIMRELQSLGKPLHGRPEPTAAELRRKLRARKP